MTVKSSQNIVRPPLAVSSVRSKSEWMGMGAILGDLSGFSCHFPSNHLSGFYVISLQIISGVRSHLPLIIVHDSEEQRMTKAASGHGRVISTTFIREVQLLYI